MPNFGRGGIILAILKNKWKREFNKSLFATEGQCLAVVVAAEK